MDEETASASATSAATSSVVARPPRSGVRAPSSSTPVTARSMARAAARLVELVEQQRDRQDRARGVGRATPGDVGRRAVDRLEDAGPAVGQRRRRCEPDAAADSGREVGEHVSEEVLGHDHVEGGGALDEQHRHRVDELMLERDAGVLLGDLAGHAPPELRGREHVGLVDARDPAAAATGEHAGTLHDPADLERAVVTGVVRGLVAEPAVAEVDPTDQLAHDHEIEAGDELVAQRARRVARVAARRPQVRVAAEHRAQREQSLLGPYRCAVPARSRRRLQAAPRPPRGRPRGLRPGTDGPWHPPRHPRTSARPARRENRSATPRCPVRAVPLA